MSSNRSALWRLALAAFAGLLLALAFPPFDLWLPLLPFAVAALTVAVRGASVRLGALCGLVAGLVFFLFLIPVPGVQPADKALLSFAFHSKGLLVWWLRQCHHPVGSLLSAMVQMGRRKIKGMARLGVEEQRGQQL